MFADFDYNSSINLVTITDEITGCGTMLDFSACDPFVKKVLRNVLVFDRLFYDEREVLWDDERGARAAPPKKMKVIFLK